MAVRENEEKLFSDSLDNLFDFFAHSDILLLMAIIEDNNNLF